MDDPGLLTEWARLLIGTLVRCGVSQAIISPGSRSTPFALAALREPGLTCHSVVDERAAGFFALAQGKLSGRPSLLICTSGTAPAHYFPAVVEARVSHSPLLILTADRPLELLDCGAAQTVNQNQMFGDQVISFVELGLPESAPSALRALVRRVAQAVHGSRFPVAGPIHLNARAQKPLEPQGSRPELAQRVDQLLHQGPPRASESTLQAPAAALGELADACAGARRGLLVCGTELPWRAPSLEQVFRVSELARFSMVAEAGSQLRSGCPPYPSSAALALADAHDLLLSVPEFAARAKPDVVLQIGSAPLAASLERLVDASAELHVVAGQGWPDPSQKARSLLIGNLEASLSGLTSALGRRGDAPPAIRQARDEYRAFWSQANQLAWLAVEEGLTHFLPAFNEAQVLRDTLFGIPRGGLLAVGNSLSIRQIDSFCPARPEPYAVWTQRGANGIDGLVAGAVGMAALGRPTTLILGDVSLRHDQGALCLAAASPVPLVIVVLNNGGGRIFEQLPIARAASPEELPFWTTPEDVDFEALATYSRVAYCCPKTPQDFQLALRQAQVRAGCTLIEARVPSSGALALRQHLQGAVSEALQPLLARAP